MKTKASSPSAVAAPLRPGRVPRRKRAGPARALGAVRPNPLGRPALVALLGRAMQSLGEEHRLPISLCCELGLSRSEAAEVLDLDPGTLCRRLETGLGRLCELAARAGRPATPAVVITCLAHTVPPAPARLMAAVGRMVAGYGRAAGPEGNR